MKTLILAAIAALALQAQQTPAPAKAEPSSTPIAAPAKKAPKPNADGTVQIETTLGELFAAWSSLVKVSSVEMPIPISRTLKKTKAAVKVELDLFNEQRSDLFVKYGVKEGTNIDLAPEKLAQLNAEWKTLTEITVKLTITQIPISALGSGKLSANDIDNLEPFLETEK